MKVRKNAYTFKKKAQIKAKDNIKILLFEKALTIILAKYSNYSNVFLLKNTVELLDYIEINDYILELKKNK